VNPILEEILRTRKVTSEDGKRFPLRDEISMNEGALLQHIIDEIKPRTSLEIGCAYGISALFICESLKKVGATKHIVIDPNQNSLFNGIGLKNLRQAGYEDLIEFIEQPSEIALPRLLEHETRIDFAFIDGWHTFGHTLLDFFYVNRMLNVGGVVAFDDTNWKSISKLCRFISRYPCYRIFGILPPETKNLHAQTIRSFSMTKKLVKSLITHVIALKPSLEYFKQDLKIARAGRCIAFIKEKEDKRNYNWHIDF
jgi:predicted O-methyltransferase YrrM